MWQSPGNQSTGRLTTAAAIDRLVHHSVILEFTGPSFRSDKAKSDKTPGTDKPTKTKAK